MPLYDAQGKEIAGAMTAEEANVKIQEAAASAKAAAEQQAAKLQTELETAQKEAADLKGKMEGLNDTDKNFVAIRTQLNDANEKVKNLEGKITEVATRGSTDSRDRMISTLAKGDAELEKKLKFNYEHLSLPETTEAERQAKIELAYKMSVDHVTPDGLKGIRSMVGGGAPPSSGTNQSVTPELVEAGKKFGISEDDLKKHLK